MDSVDKQIILELFGNCRTTYRSMSKNLSLSSTSIRKRVLKLRESGLISRGYVLVSLAMLDAEYCYARIKTDGSEKDEDLVESIGTNDVVMEVIRTDKQNLSIFASVVGSPGLYELGKFLRSFDCVVDTTLSFIHPVTPSPLPNHHQYVYRGQKVDLTKTQLTVLKHLWSDARTPASEIAKLINYSTSRVQQIIRDLQSNRGLYFTVFSNWSAAGIIPFLIIIDYDERKATPHEAVKWIQDRYPFEYWNSWQIADVPRLLHFCTAAKIKSIDKMTNEVKDAPFAIQVGCDVLHPQNHHVGLGHIRLGELLGIRTRNHRVECYTTEANQFY